MSYSPHPQAPRYWQYDGLPVQAELETHQAAVQMARRVLSPGAHILDVAAGHGALSKALLDAGFDVACTSWNDRLTLQVPAYRIDLDKSFGSEQVGARKYDLICAIEIIEHVENPAQLLRSVAGLLEPGGWLVVSTPNVESAPARLEWLLRGCPYSFHGEEITHNRHISILWREGMEQFIRLAGFDIVEKQLHGKVRFNGILQWLIKRPLHLLMGWFLPGDLHGNSRLYLLRRNSGKPRSMGAEEVA